MESFIIYSGGSIVKLVTVSNTELVLYIYPKKGLFIRLTKVLLRLFDNLRIQFIKKFIAFSVALSVRYGNLSTDEIQTLNCISHNAITNVSTVSDNMLDVNTQVTINLKKRVEKKKLLFSDIEKVYVTKGKKAIKSNSLSLVPSSYLFHSPRSYTTKRALSSLQSKEAVKFLEGPSLMNTPESRELVLSSENLQKALQVKGGTDTKDEQGPIYFVVGPPRVTEPSTKILTWTPARYRLVNSEGNGLPRFVSVQLPFKEQKKLLDAQGGVQALINPQSLSAANSVVESSKGLSHPYLVGRDKVPFGQSRGTVSKWADGFISESDISVLYTALHNFKVYERKLSIERFRIGIDYEDAKKEALQNYSRLKAECEVNFTDKASQNQKFKKLEKKFNKQLEMLKNKRKAALKNLDAANEQHDLERKRINRCMYAIGHPQIKRQRWYSIRFKDNILNFRATLKINAKEIRSWFWGDSETTDLF